MGATGKYSSNREQHIQHDATSCQSKLKGMASSLRHWWRMINKAIYSLHWQNTCVLASEMTGISITCSTVSSYQQQGKHQTSTLQTLCVRYPPVINDLPTKKARYYSRVSVDTGYACLLKRNLKQSISSQGINRHCIDLLYRIYMYKTWFGIGSSINHCVRNNDTVYSH